MPTSKPAATSAPTPTQDATSRAPWRTPAIRTLALLVAAAACAAVMAIPPRRGPRTYDADDAPPAPAQPATATDPATRFAEAKLRREAWTRPRAAPVDAVPAQLEEALAQDARTLREAMQDSSAWARYEACRQAGDGGDARDGGCDALADRALFAALSIHQESQELLAGGRIHRDGREAVERALGEQLASDDALVRVSALSMLRSQRDLATARLPAHAYDGLASRSVVEATLLLDHHAGVPAPEASVAEAIAALALDPEADPRVRVRAARALTFERDAALLDRVAAAWLAEGQAPFAPLELAVSLQRCGDPCAERLQQLRADPRPELRAAAALLPEQDLDEQPPGGSIDDVGRSHPEGEET